jgi:hypothetical protein
MPDEFPDEDQEDPDTPDDLRPPVEKYLPLKIFRKTMSSTYPVLTGKTIAVPETVAVSRTHFLTYVPAPMNDPVGSTPVHYKLPAHGDGRGGAVVYHFRKNQLRKVDRTNLEKQVLSSLRDDVDDETASHEISDEEFWRARSQHSKIDVKRVGALKRFRERVDKRVRELLRELPANCGLSEQDWYKQIER